MEEREYNEDSSEADIQVLKDRVELLEDDIIYFNEAIVISEFQCEVMWNKVNELIDRSKSNYLLINLVNSKPPNAPQRAKIKEKFQLFNEHIKYAALYTEKNKLINLVAKFVLGGAGLNDHSIHKTREEALNAIKYAKNK